MKRAAMGLAAALAALAAIFASLGRRATPATHTVDRQALEGYFPEVVVRSHDGADLDFYRDCLQGKTVLVNFVFTRCGSYCPRATDNLREVQRKLGASVGREVFFYSITVDPGNDTPEVLAQFARSHGVGPGWRFLTGAPADLEAIQRCFGSFDRSKANHTGLLICGNEPSGRWISLPAVTEPDEIVAAVERLQGFVLARAR